MRLVFIAFLITLSSSAFAEMSNNRLRVLLNICDAAQISSDLGTVKNIGMQIQNINPPKNKQLEDKYNKCLHAAFGKLEKKPDVNDLIKEVEKAYSKLEDQCRSLLRTVPEIAIVHPICKSVLTKP
jgi:predicted ribosome quality control (RQC) complex YloA/Tae2 family protein